MREGHRPEVADVFRRYGSEYERVHGASTTAEQRRVLRELAVCRTRALGGHKRRCDGCAHEVLCYNSCRNRHCPKCLARARALWLEARRLELIEVPYFHVVFTLRQELGPLARHNPRAVYDLLFRAAAETLEVIARDPRHLGAEIGFLAVLHTWGQTLQHHPHVHCLVPGGGLSRDGLHWVRCRPGFFLPVRVLSRVFRGKFLAGLEALRREGKLRFPVQLAPLGSPARWTRWLRALRSKDWVVYAKPPFGGPEQVLKYLARYTHRVAISNDRLLEVKEGHVRFGWRDYAHGGRPCTMTLEAVEFIRRFLIHVLPRAFVRIRHYGFLSNRQRSRRLPRIRSLVAEARSAPVSRCAAAVTDADPDRCPRCKRGRLVVVERIEPCGGWPPEPCALDTS